MPPAVVPPVQEPISPTAGAELVSLATSVGGELAESLRALVGQLPGAAGPVALARRLKIDKVLASRVLKALRSPEPLAVIHAVPGPEPLRRLVRSAARVGASDTVVRRCNEAIAAFEGFVRG